MSPVYGRVAVAAIMLTLWLVLSGAMKLSDIATGLLVAAAVAAWVPLGDL
jgi:hypothetical protein